MRTTTTSEGTQLLLLLLQNLSSQLVVSHWDFPIPAPRLRIQGLRSPLPVLHLVDGGLRVLNPKPHCERLQDMYTYW